MNYWRTQSYRCFASNLFSLLERFETNDGDNEDNDRSSARSPEVRQMQTQLVKHIHSFIRIEIKFSLRRLLKADIKQLFVGKSAQQLSLTVDLKSNQLFSDDSMHCNQYRVHPIKGGLQIRPYLTYNWYFPYLFCSLSIFIYTFFHSIDFRVIF